ncbi:MAG: RluA family pseudouridine synthase [Candidatus Peribacteraceae bacterium]|nr:RluA family pseudouridine synthase [Candidatus Peribacteraceae bacterium]
MVQNTAVQQFPVTAKQRLDLFLVAEAGLSRARVQGLIKEGRVKVNGHAVTKVAQVLHAGEVVVLASSDHVPKDSAVTWPADLKLTVLYEDDACLVLNKPAGYAVHPAPTTKGEKTILHGVAHLFNARSLPFSADAVLVHRLDRETTGCLLIAKTAEAHGALQKQFEERTTRKTYLALVAGVPQPPEAVIDAPVGRQLTDRTRMSVFKTSVSREAKTTYRTLSASQGCAFLACDLHTGRTHQVRVHLSSIGHPILGDPTYRSPESEKLTEEFAVQNLCLHAWQLTFRSPADGEKHTVEAPLPATFKTAIQSVGVEFVHNES